MKIIYQSVPHAAISLNLDNQVLQVDFDGLVSSSVYRKTLLHALDIIVSRGIQKCIYNRNKLKTLSPDDHDWVAEQLLPLLLQTTVQKVAILESHDSLEQLNLRNMVYAPYLSLSFEVQYFEEPDLALNWLNQEETQVVTQQFHVPEKH
ncbi:MAG: hypothetical protein ACO1OQ_03720 [Rufibacter sp.]